MRSKSSEIQTYSQPADHRWHDGKPAIEVVSAVPRPEASKMSWKVPLVLIAVCCFEGPMSFCQP